MRQPEDGHFHTGDLFLEVVPGRYSFRGRMCEWIRNSTGYWYDAKCVHAIFREKVAHALIMLRLLPSRLFV